MTLNDMFFGLLEGGGNIFRGLGIIVGIIAFVMLFCSLDSVDMIIVGIAIVVFIPIMILLDIRKKKEKEREKEPWDHNL